MIETLRIKPSLKWIHILNPTENDFDFLINNFHFHPLDIEDCRSKTQRPKLDVYEDYYFIILHFPHFDKKSSLLETKEVKIFWGKEYIITMGNTHWVVKDLFNKIKNTVRKDLNGFDSSDILLYKMLERLMTETMTLMNKIGSDVENINIELFNKRAEKTIEHISISRKNIIQLDTIFKPQLRFFIKFESGDVKGFAKDMEDYWGNILDYYQKTWDMVEDYKELIEGLSKTFDSLQANKINEIMKVLTFFSSILLPLTFITGLYGMNIGLPFQNHPFSFLIVSGFMITIIFTLIVFFKRRKWM